MSSEPTMDSPDPRLRAALAEYLERIDRGVAVDREAFLAEYPDLAAELTPLLETADALEQIGGPPGEPNPPDVSTHSQISADIETIAPGREAEPGKKSGGLPKEFGRYRIIKALGQGAMGVVYLAQDTQLNRQVALKTSSFDNDHSGELLERFYREARSAATLRHPNICPVHDVGEIDGRHYISLAYIEGRTLATYVNASGRLQERQVLHLVRKLALALQEAHEHEIVHRDLKPANIMVDQRGEPVIMDFGLARVGYSDEESRLTQVGMIVGSPAYMAPEQIGGQPELLTGAADQYGLGVILFELLVGHPPFRGPVTAVVGQILTQPPPRLSTLRSDVSPAVEALCLKMLAKSPGDRFASMKQVADEIAALLRGSSAESRSPAASAKSVLEAPSPPEADIPRTSVHMALVQEARRRLKQRDYPKAIEMLQQIPEAERAPEAAKLLAHALKLMDEVNFVLQEMEAALQSRDGAKLAKRAQELVSLKPDHPRARQVRELIKKHGPEKALQFLAEDSGTTPARRVGRPVGRLVGGLTAGLALLLAIIWFQFGDSRVKVEVLAEGYEIKFNEAEITVTDGTRETKVKPGDHTLHVKSLKPGNDGTVDEFDTDKLTLKKGGQPVLIVTRENSEVVAKLDGQVIPRRSLTGPAPPGRQQIDTATAHDSAEKTPIFQTSEELIENSNGAKSQPAGSVGWKVVSGQWNIPDTSDKAFADPYAHFCAGNTHTGIIEQVVDVSRFADVIDSANVEFKLSWKLGCFDSDVGAVALTPLDSDRKELDTAYDSGWQNHQPWTDWKRFDSSIVPAKGVRYLRLRVSSQRSRRPGNQQSSAYFREISLRAVVKQPFTPPSVSDDGPWVSLFNGKDLTNWKLHADQPGGWSVEDGLLVGRSWDANHLFSESGDFENFHLRAELKTEHQSNGGICIRSPFALDRGGKFPSGYEAQILHSHANGPWTGSLLTPGIPVIEQLPHERPVLVAGEWFTLDMIAVGNVFTVKVNGKTTTNIRDESNLYRTGHIALQAMVETGVTTPTIIHFKKIEAKRLKIANTATPDPSGEIDPLASAPPSVTSPLQPPRGKWTMLLENNDQLQQWSVKEEFKSAIKMEGAVLTIDTQFADNNVIELHRDVTASSFVLHVESQKSCFSCKHWLGSNDLKLGNTTFWQVFELWRSERASKSNTMLVSVPIGSDAGQAAWGQFDTLVLDGVVTFYENGRKLFSSRLADDQIKQLGLSARQGGGGTGWRGGTASFRNVAIMPLTPEQVAEARTGKLPKFVAPTATTGTLTPPGVAPMTPSSTPGKAGETAASSTTARPAQLPEESGLPLRWLSLSVHDPAAFDAAANLANLIEDRSWQTHGDALTRKARERGVPTILAFHRSDYIEYLAGRAPDFESRLHAFVKANRDVIAGVAFLAPYSNTERECIAHVGPFGRRLKAAFPGLEYWVSYIESPGSWVGPLPAVPPEVDVVQMEAYFAWTPQTVQAKFDQHLAKWKTLATGRPLVFRWVTLQLKSQPQVLKTEAGTVDRVLATAVQLGLPGVGIDSFGPRNDGYSTPIDSDPRALAELTAFAQRHRYGEQHRLRGKPSLVTLSALNSEGVDDASPWVLPSGLAIYFTCEQAGKDPTIYRAERRDLNTPFTSPQPVLNGRHMAVSADETYAVLLPGQYVAAGVLSEISRTKSTDPWSKPRPIASLASQSNPKSPWLSADGLTLVYQRKRTVSDLPGQTTEFAICRRKSRTEAWGEPALLPISPSGSLTQTLTWPCLSEDLLTLTFCHGGDRHPEVYAASRKTATEPFGNFARIDLDGRPLICRSPRVCAATGDLYLSSDRDSNKPDSDLFYLTTKAGSSAPPVQLAASPMRLSGFRHGLKAEIFEGKNFEKKVLERMDPNLECLWDWGSPAREAPVDQFSVRFSGWLRAPKDGLYRIGSWSDDGVRVSINGKMVIDRWQLEKGYSDATVPLTEEPQSIVVEAFDHDASSWMSIFWQGPGETALSPIPSEALYPDEASARVLPKDQPPSVNGLTAEYFDKAFTTKLATQRVYQAQSIWYTGAPLPGLPTQACVRYTGVLVPPVSGDYQLVSAARTGMKVWFDSDLVMDASFPPKKSPVRLEARKPCVLKIEHVNLDGQGSYYLHWIPPGETREVPIPPECLFPTLESVSGASVALTQPRVAPSVTEPAMPKAPEGTPLKGSAVEPDTEKAGAPGDREPQEVRHGLKAEIFEGRNFEKKVSERIEPNVECFWELGAPASEAPVDNFSVRFTGWLRAPKAGRYKLFLSSRDGSRLKINNQTVIDNWKIKPEVADVSLELTQDPQPIEVEVFNADLHSWVSLLWQPAGAPAPCHIPTTALFPDLINVRSKAGRSVAERTGLVAEYYDKTFRRKLATDRVYRIEEIWGAHSPRWGLPTDSAVRYSGILVPPVSGQYKLIASARGQIRIWIDDQPTLEAKGIQLQPNAVIKLEANKPHEIRVEVLTTTHGAHYLHWIPPQSTKEVSIPPECLFPNKAAVRQAKGARDMTAIPADPRANPGADEWIDLFNGRDLSGWEVVSSRGVVRTATDGGWPVSSGVLRCDTGDDGWLRSTEDYEDFELELEFQTTASANGGILIRTRDSAAPPADGLEIDLHSSAAGGIASVVTPSKSHLRPVGEWNQLKVRATGLKYVVDLNGQRTADADLAGHPRAFKLHPSGRIGIYNYKGLARDMAFRNIRIQRLKPADKPAGRVDSTPP